MPIINYVRFTLTGSIKILIELPGVQVLCGMMMTGCDVSAIAKPWSIQHRVAKLVAEEFFEQGDMEKLQLNETPIVMSFSVNVPYRLFLSLFIALPGNDGPG